MYKVAIAVRDGMEVSYGTHASAREAVNAYSSAVIFLLSDEFYGTADNDSKYNEAMYNALNATHESADLTGHSRDGEGDVWTLTFRYAGGYARMTGGL